jgi:hypothetical protein
VIGAAGSKALELIPPLVAVGTLPSRMPVMFESSYAIWTSSTIEGFSTI